MLNVSYFSFHWPLKRLAYYSYLKYDAVSSDSCKTAFCNHKIIYTWIVKYFEDHSSCLTNYISVHAIALVFLQALMLFYPTEKCHICHLMCRSISHKLMLKESLCIFVNIVERHTWRMLQKCSSILQSAKNFLKAQNIKQTRVPLKEKMVLLYQSQITSHQLLVPLISEDSLILWMNIAREMQMNVLLVQSMQLAHRWCCHPVCTGRDSWIFSGQHAPPTTSHVWPPWPW